MFKLRLIAVDIDAWDPPDEVYERLLSLLYDDEAAARIRRYRHARDRLGNLLGRLMPLLDLCTTSSRYTWKQLAQAKEPAGRPYLASSDWTMRDRIPYYDFNISHDGCILLVATCYSTTGDTVPFRLGADVMRLGLPDGIPNIAEFEETVKDLLTTEEKKTIVIAEEQEKLDLLMYYWATKEAVSKAVGAGLSYGYEKLDSSAVRETGEMPLPELGKACTIKEWETSGADGTYLCILALLPNSAKQAEETELQPRLQDLQVEKLDVDQLVQEIMMCATAGE